MSGPLATWVGEHSKASWKGRAVLLQYALASEPDGTPAADLTREDLERRTGMPRTTVGRGRHEVEDLGELQLLDAGGGRGRPSRWRVVVTLCGSEAGCWSCDRLLRPLLEKGVRSGPVSPGDTPEKGVPTGPISIRNGSAQTPKGSPENRKGSPPDPTTENGGTAPTPGGAVPPPRSGDREPLRVASGSAARSGQKLDDPAPAAAAIPEEARRLIAEFKRESLLHRHGISPPAAAGLDPPAEASPANRPQVAGKAPAEQVAAEPALVVIPVEDPADVSYPSGLGAVVGPCVVCEGACTSIHNVSGQPRHPIHAA